MSITNIIHSIESGYVNCDLMLASTTRTLIRRMENNEVLKIAKYYFQEYEDQYLERLKDLYGVPEDHQYMQPKDLIVAAYIYLLSSSDEAKSLINRIAEDNRRDFPGASALAKFLIMDG